MLQQEKSRHKKRQVNKTQGVEIYTLRWMEIFVSTLYQKSKMYQKWKDCIKSERIFVVELNDQITGATRNDPVHDHIMTIVTINKGWRQWEEREIARMSEREGEGERTWVAIHFYLYSFRTVIRLDSLTEWMVESWVK